MEGTGLGVIKIVRKVALEGVYFFNLQCTVEVGIYNRLTKLNDTYHSCQIKAVELV